MYQPRQRLFGRQVVELQRVFDMTHAWVRIS